MPHVVVDAEPDLKDFAAAFEPWKDVRGQDVLRADRCYAEADGRTALVECLAKEAGRIQKFYITCNRAREGGTTVRLDPVTDPPAKTDGVRRLVAAIGRQLRDHTGAPFGATNIQPFLDEAGD